MNFDQVEAFLLLAQELHFGRTAERLYRSQPQVSRLITTLETEVGGLLFERTSRRVKLTALGVRFEQRVRPAHAALLAAFEDAAATARSTAGVLRIGTPSTIDSAAILDVLDTFSRDHPNCEAALLDVGIWEPYKELRQGDIDVLCSWQACDEPDLRVGPVIEQRGRFLAVGTKHRLADRRTISIEDLADEVINRTPARFPAAMAEAFHPSRTPSGRTIPRTDREMESVAEVTAEISRGRIVSPTVSPHNRYTPHPDIVLIPITDMPPLQLGLIWRKADENARILELARTVRARRPRSLRVSAQR